MVSIPVCVIAVRQAVLPVQALTTQQLQEVRSEAATLQVQVIELRAWQQQTQATQVRSSTA